MENISSLKKLIKLLFYVFFSSIFLFAIKGLFAYMENDNTYLGECANDNNYGTLILFVFILKIASKIIFFIGGFYLIKTLNFKTLKDIFTNQKIKLFKKSAGLFIVSASVGFFAFLISGFKSGFANLKIDTDFLYSLYFLVIVGLFLLIFSKILEKAKELKQENDLTI